MCIAEMKSSQARSEEVKDAKNRKTEQTEHLKEAGDVENMKTERIVATTKATATMNIKRNEDDRHFFDFYKSLPSTYQFVLLSGSMIILFSIHNVLQEAIMRIPDFEYGVMLGYMEVLGVSLFSFLERRYKTNERGHVAPLSQYTFLTACLLTSSSFSSMSLNYINFPTKVVFRSCKLLPAMLISTLINRRNFSGNEYRCAFAISAGLVMFAAADWKLTPSFNPWGISLVSVSVIADAALPIFQERLFKFGSSRLEVTFFTNFFTLVAMTFTTAMSGDLLAVIKLASSNSTLAFYMIMFIMISYAAISSFMMIVKNYGGVTAVLLGTVRKGVTIALSFLLFPKPFSMMYVAGAFFVLSGLTSVSLEKLSKKKEKETAGVESDDIEKCETKQTNEGDKATF